MTTKKKAPAKKATKPVAKKTTKKATALKPKSSAKPAAKKSATKKIPAKAPVTKKSTPVTGALAAVHAMAKAAAKALDAAKAEDIVTIDLTRKSALADYMIVASGRSGRAVSALARFAEEALIKAGSKRCRIEGAAQGDWVVVDGGDVVVHLFRPEVREFYQLEKLWSDDAPTPTATRSKRSLA